MVQVIHIANTNVEFEFANPSRVPIEQGLSLHPLCLQLQYLPLLYADKDDMIAVTAMPKSDYLFSLKQTGWWADGIPQLIPLQEIEPFYGKQCCSWGPSRQVQAWAEARQMSYAIPQDWQTVRLVNSKEFSFRYNSLEEAVLIYHEKELDNWLRKTQGAKVIKTCFGLSGQGNRIIDQDTSFSKILTFCQKEWRQGRPLIGEPWLERLCDFSTQWIIHPDRSIEWIGATRFKTDSHGNYQGTVAGAEDVLFDGLKPYLTEHRKFALNALIDIAKMGFFGFIGIDALLYRHPKTREISLYPLVEINGRQTMSLIALRMQRRLFPQQIFCLTFNHDDNSQFSLLPDQSTNFKGKIIPFKRRLIATILSDIQELNEGILI